MNMQSVYAEIQRELELIALGIGADANVPIKTGNLRKSIKLRQLSPGKFQLYIDEEQAGYAEQVEQYKPYWNRVAMELSYRLAARLGGEGYKDYTPNIK